MAAAGPGLVSGAACDRGELGLVARGPAAGGPGSPIWEGALRGAGRGAHILLGGAGRGALTRGLRVPPLKSISVAPVRYILVLPLK
jgi:hypothetical protein